MAPSWIDPALRAGLGLSLMGLLAPSLQASPKDPPYPSMDQLRELQLHTFACGRDNTAESCTKARTMADPLMDHPRLGASCKDAIWTIRQRAQPATTNSYERREALNRAGQDLLAFCKQQTRTVAPSKTETKPQEKKGFGLIPGS
jgi:plasmid stabilization system protein ParE